MWPTMPKKVSRSTRSLRTISPIFKPESMTSSPPEMSNASNGNVISKVDSPNPSRWPDRTKEEWTKAWEDPVPNKDSQGQRWEEAKAWVWITWEVLVDSTNPNNRIWEWVWAWVRCPTKAWIRTKEWEWTKATTHTWVIRWAIRWEVKDSHQCNKVEWECKVWETKVATWTGSNRTSHTTRCKTKGMVTTWEAVITKVVNIEDD